MDINEYSIIIIIRTIIKIIGTHIKRYDCKGNEMDSGESNLRRGGLELKIICYTVWGIYKNNSEGEG